MGNVNDFFCDLGWEMIQKEKRGPRTQLLNFAEFQDFLLLFSCYICHTYISHISQSQEEKRRAPRGREGPKQTVRNSKFQDVFCAFFPALSFTTTALKCQNVQAKELTMGCRWVTSLKFLPFEVENDSKGKIL